MILILCSFLMIISTMIINFIKSINNRLLLGRILPTSDSCGPLLDNLKAIPHIILRSSSTGLIVIHVEDLPQILRSPIGPPITDQEEHNCIRMIPSLDVVIHPYLAQNIYRFNTKSLPSAMSYSRTPCDIRNTKDLTDMGHIMTLFI